MGRKQAPSILPDLQKRGFFRPENLLVETLDFDTRGSERYLGFFTSQNVFRSALVFVTTERIIIRKTKHWIWSWVIGTAIGVLLLILTMLRVVDPTVGYALPVIIPIPTALGIQQLFKRKYKAFRHVQAEEHDIQFTKSQVIQIQISPFHGFHPARLTITPTSGEVVSLPFINEKAFKIASRLMTRFNPTAMKPEEQV